MFVVRLCTLEMKKWLLVLSLIHAVANSVARSQFLCSVFYVLFFWSKKFDHRNETFDAVP